VTPESIIEKQIRDLNDQIHRLTTEKQALQDALGRMKESAPNVNENHSQLLKG